MTEGERDNRIARQLVTGHAVRKQREEGYCSALFPLFLLSGIPGHWMMQSALGWVSLPQ